jgi:hypothetical protein
MNTTKASEYRLGTIDWQKLLSTMLDYPIQTSLFIINFAFLLLVEPPILLSILLLSALVYSIFSFGDRLSRVVNLPESHPILAEGHITAANPTVVESVEAPPAPITSEPAKSSTRRVSQSAGETRGSQAKPQRTRRRAAKS